MPFTNLWDQLFPPDTQLASQGAADLRQLRVDTQQRMASISGLDASKPNFAGDVQPASWNGVLFFATDTGKIYQFNNPSWTDVTLIFRGSAALYKNVTPVTHSGTTTVDVIWTVPVPVISIGNILKFRFGVIRNSSTGSTDIIFNNSVIATISSTSANTGAGFIFDLAIAVTGTTLGNLNYLIGYNEFASSPPVPLAGASVPIPSIAAPQNWTISAHNSSVAADSYTFPWVLAELF